MPAPMLAHGPIDHDRYADAYLRGILERTGTVAMVGASPEPWRPGYGVMRYLQRHGYRVIPVNPHAVGQTVHGERFHASLGKVPERIDMVDIFRRPDAVGGVVDEAIAAGVPVVWMQLGIRDDAACARAEAAGLRVVMNRCISSEHARLLR